VPARSPVLDAIVERKISEVERLLPSAAELRAAALASPPARGFAAALAAPAGTIRLIAEIKRRSPSRGLLRADFDPSRLARDMARAGASALSVLTDAASFGGSLDDLRCARGAAAIPVLRKDFVLDESQLAEARAAGADAALLIVRILTRRRLGELLAEAGALGLDALVETHDEAEVDAALEAGATIVGVNCRDLGTFRVDLGVSERLLRRIPADRLRVAESGIASADDVARVKASGANAILVGEALMTSGNVADAVKALLKGA